MKSLSLGTAAAWIVIAGLVASTYWEQAQSSEKVRAGGDEIGVILQGRLALGMKELTGDARQARDQVRQLKTGPYGQRLLVAILVADLDGSEPAREYLAEVEKLRAERERTLTESEQRLAAILGKLFAPQAEATLSDPDRAWLEERYRWLGRLAVSLRPGADPAEGKGLRLEARSGLLLLTAFLLLGGVIGLVGVVLLFLFATRWYHDQVSWSPGPAENTGVFVEAFAVWFAAFRGLSYLSRHAPAVDSLQATGLVMLLSTLLALGWCRARGLAWNQVRGEIGLHSNRSLGRELLAGLATYAAMLPLILLSVLLLTGLTNLLDRGPVGGAESDPFAPSNRPAHPVARQILGDVGTVLSIFLIAAVVAPLVEEIAFRGLLQRHLRGLLGRLSSALGVGFIFAIIHPQGLAGVPALLAIALPLSIAREWRGSLVAPVLAHALNNGAVALLLLITVR